MEEIKNDGNAAASTVQTTPAPGDTKPAAEPVQPAQPTAADTKPIVPSSGDALPL